MAKTRRPPAGSADAYVHSLRDGERFYASWVLDWLRAGQPSYAESFDEATRHLPSPPGYPAQWPEARAQGIAREVFLRYRAEQGEGAEEGARQRYARQRHLARDVADAARRDASLRRLEATLSGRRRRRGLLLREASRVLRRRGRR